MNSKFPTKITPCPIIESVVEIVYDRNLGIEPGAIYGKVYDELKLRYEKVESLPISQLPEDLRLNDPKLKNKPWYKFSNELFEVLIGGSVLVIVAKKEYKGWTKYCEEINYVFNVFKKSNIFSSITKIGLKYVDLFEFPIINKIGINIGSSLPINESLEIQFRSVIPEKYGLNGIVAVMNNITIEHLEEIKQNVSLLDIDVFKVYEAKDECKYEEAIKVLENAHKYQKELFFNLVNEDFLVKNNFCVEKE